MESSPWLRALIVLLVFAVGLHLATLLWQLAGYFADVLMLFFLAWLLAFVLKPPAVLMAARRRVPWPAAVLLVYGLLILVLGASLLVLVPILAVQLTQFGAAMLAWVQTWPTLLEWLQGELGRRGVQVDQSALPRPADLGAQVERVLSTLLQGGIGLLTGAANLMFNLAIILMLSFYVMLDGERIAEGVIYLTPEQWRPEVRYFLASVDRTFGGFIRGQVLQGLIYGAGTGAVAVLLGLDFALLLAMLAGLLMLIPVVGAFLAIAPPLLVAGLHGGWGTIVLAGVALIGLQQIVLNVIAPRIVGHAVGLHPLLFFLAMLVGLKIGGAAGALFGVPVAGVINAMALFLARQSPRATLAPRSERPADVGRPRPPRLFLAARRICERLWRTTL
ncbi:MAG: AI-2E family transporter [Chloroflexi bacterium]|nr:AI-2E family transporter [Chloroflexota bacterium]